MISDKNKTLLHDVILMVGMTIILITAVLPLLGVKLPMARAIFAGGAALVLAARLVEVYKGKNLRVRRLYVLNKVAAVFFCIAAATLFHPLSAGNDWVAFLIAGTFTQAYVLAVLPRAEANDKGNTQ